MHKIFYIKVNLFNNYKNKNMEIKTNNIKSQVLAIYGLKIFKFHRDLIPIVLSFNKIKIKLTCGWNYTIAVDIYGKIYTWGRN